MYWGVEAAFVAEGKEKRHRTFSEAMHEMSEQAIQSFYAKQASSVLVGFVDLYFRDFGRAYPTLKNAYEYVKMEGEIREKVVAEKQQSARGTGFRDAIGGGRYSVPVEEPSTTIAGITTRPQPSLTRPTPGSTSRWSSVGGS